MMPFYEMYFPDTWNDNNLPRNPFELVELCDHLNIKVNTDFLYTEYETTEYKKGDIYIFYPSDRKDIFIYFDLLKDEHDQMARHAPLQQWKNKIRRLVHNKIWFFIQYNKS